MSHTVFTIPCGAEYYGPYASDEEAMEFAKIIQGEIEKYAKAHDFHVEAKLVPETLSRGNQSRGDSSTIDELDRLLEAKWLKWIEQYESGNKEDTTTETELDQLSRPRIPGLAHA